MREKKSLTIIDIFVFLMIFIYFTLNARYLNFPGSHILRWIFPIVLVLVTMFYQKCVIKPTAFLCFFSIAVFPSIIGGIDPKTSFLKFLAFILILYGSYIFFMGNSVIYVEHYFHIFAIVVIFFQLLNVFFTVTGIGYDSGRATGITTNANTLGIYSNIAFWAAVYMLNRLQRTYLKIIYFIIAGTTVYTALASGSRSAFIVIALNLFFVGIIKYRHSSTIIFYIIGVGLTVYLLLNGKLDFLHLSALERLAEQGTDRGDLWKVGLSIWRQYQTFGCGYTVSNQINSVVLGMQFHNSYLSYLIECGTWGVIVLGFGFGGFGMKVLKNIKNCTDDFSFHPFLFACFIVLDLALTAYGESFLFAVGSTEGFTFWFLIAWILAYINQHNYEASLRGIKE